MNTSVLDYNDLARLAARALATRPATVWDARRILAPRFGRWVAVSVDDGQFQGTSCEGVLRNVVHTPIEGYALVLDRVRTTTAHRRPIRRSVRLPIRLITDLPSDLEFLRRPAPSWPYPPPFIRCLHCGADAVTGRFCHDCGIPARSGRTWVGAGFSEVQRLGRENRLGRECSCGALVVAGMRHCTKCGR